MAVLALYVVFWTIIYRQCSNSPILGGMLPIFFYHYVIVFFIYLFIFDKISTEFFPACVQVQNFIVCTSSTLLEHVPTIRSGVVTLLCLVFTADQCFVCRRRGGYWASLDSQCSRSCSSYRGLAIALQWLMLTVLAAFSGYDSVVYEYAGSPRAGCLGWYSVQVADWLARLIASVPSLVIIIMIILFIIRSIVNRAAGRLSHTIVTRPF